MFRARLCFVIYSAAMCKSYTEEQNVKEGNEGWEGCHGSNWQETPTYPLETRL